MSFPTATVPGPWIRPGSASRQNGCVGVSGYNGQRGRAWGTAAEYVALDYAVQLAKWAGTGVIATVSSAAKAQQAVAAGADIVVNYRSEDAAARVLEVTSGIGVDRIVEVDFGGNLEACLKSIRVNGTIAVYASRGSLEPTLPVSTFMRKNATLRLMVLNTCPLDARRQAQREIVQWLETGARSIASLRASHSSVPSMRTSKSKRAESSARRSWT